VLALVRHADDPLPLLPEGMGAFTDLRQVAGLLPPGEASVLAHARGLMHWRTKHRFCGICGSRCEARSAGHVMVCQGCGAQHFPRTDPAVIMLVVRGDSCLLGHSHRFPSVTMYSTLAGFVEPGESLEDAVAREVLEETGVRVQDSEYHSSQPWPFPSSLMIGFTARATADAAPRADEELEDVRWFTREEIASGTPGLPPPQSVSFRLIEDWYDSGAALPLRETPGVKLWGRR
jgi:NAD+ diphosphatase